PDAAGRARAVAEARDDADEAAAAFGAGTGAATATVMALEIKADGPAPAASVRLCSPGGRGGGRLTNWPSAFDVSSTTVLPATTSTAPVAPAQIVDVCEGMLARFHTDI